MKKFLLTALVFIVFFNIGYSALYNATGGNITYDSGYTIHTFYTNGSFNVTGTIENASILIVAGGGGGGYSRGGGGGAGGLIYWASNVTFTADNYSAIVGIGGGGATDNSMPGYNGQNSSFYNLTAIGGGGGGSADAGATQGTNGGSGGGAPYNNAVPGNGTTGQGYAGGTSVYQYPAGGGGGSGGLGGNAPDTTHSGAGGIGTNVSINGSITCYAGGGSGAMYTNGTAGEPGCGGGRGSAVDLEHFPSAGGSATNGTGGGGGGGLYGTGGFGGSGIIIVRYATDTADEITLTTPSNTTYYGNTTQLNFSVGINSPSYNVTIQLDGVNLTSVNATNSTPYLYNLTGLNHSTHNVLVFLTENTTINESVNFTTNLINLNDTITITNALVTQSVDYYIYVYNYTSISGVSTSVYAYLNGTNYTAVLDSENSTAQTYLATLIMPDIAGTYNITTNADFNFGSYSVYQEDIQNVTTSNFSITNCTNGTASIVFNMKHEFNESYLTNATFKTIITYWLESTLFNYSYTFTNVDNATLCISPNYSTIYANVEVIISKENYSQRTNYLVNATFDNSSTNVTTYMIPNTSSALVNLELNDAFGNGKVGSYIKVQRYYTSVSSWVDITTLKTDGLGNALVYLVPYTEAYRFLIYENNTLIKTYEPMYISQSDYTFTLALGSGVDYNIFMGIASDCEWNNITKIFRCTTTDGTGLMTGGRLIVSLANSFGSTTYCNTSATGSAITLTCNLNNYSSITDGFVYGFYVDINGNTYLRNTGFFGNIPQTNAYGLNGVYLTMLIFLVMVFVGIWNPSVSVILGTLSIIIANLIGILEISQPALAILVVTSLFIIYKLRT